MTTCVVEYKRVKGMGLFVQQRDSRRGKLLEFQSIHMLKIRNSVDCQTLTRAKPSSCSPRRKSTWTESIEHEQCKERSEWQKCDCNVDNRQHFFSPPGKVSLRHLLMWQIMDVFVFHALAAPADNETLTGGGGGGPSGRTSKTQTSIFNGSGYSLFLKNHKLHDKDKPALWENGKLRTYKNNEEPVKDERTCQGGENLSRRGSFTWAPVFLPTSSTSSSAVAVPFPKRIPLVDQCHSLCTGKPVLQELHNRKACLFRACIKAGKSYKRWQGVPRPNVQKETWGRKLKENTLNYHKCSLTTTESEGDAGCYIPH